MRLSARLAPIIPLPLLLLLLGTPAHAQEVQVDTSLVCDTQAQVERFIALYDGDVSTAVEAVNTEAHDPTACAVTTAAFVRGRRLAMTRKKEGPFEIVEILVLGVVTPDGLKPVEPTASFSLFPVEEIGV
jgi:hypothetical protein